MDPAESYRNCRLIGNRALHRPAFSYSGEDCHNLLGLQGQFTTRQPVLSVISAALLSRLGLTFPILLHS